MAIPANTSTEAYPLYTGSKSVRSSRGKAWRDLKAWIVEDARETGILTLPTVNEPFLCWTFSGEVEFQEREIGGPWVMNRIKKGSFYLTTGGPPYECRWKVLPFRRHGGCQPTEGVLAAQSAAAAAEPVKMAL
jgi:AraC family transcriptional regulator